LVFEHRVDEADDRKTPRRNTPERRVTAKGRNASRDRDANPIATSELESEKT